MDDFSLARPAGHLIMGDGSGPDGLAKKDGAKALSGAESVDTATTSLDKPSRTKNLIIEWVRNMPVSALSLPKKRKNRRHAVILGGLFLSEAGPAPGVTFSSRCTRT